MARGVRILGTTLAAAGIAAVALPCLLYAGALLAIVGLERFGVPAAQLISMN
jgi:hypothetical protein